MDRKTIFALGMVLVIFAVIIVYEWGGAWRGARAAIEQTGAVAAEFLAEKKIPFYLLIVHTIVDYVKHSWLCLLLAFIAAGAMQEFVPRDKLIALMGSGKGIHPYLISGFGAPLLSMCSCSIIPIFGGLYRTGAGLGPAVTFLLAGPAFNPAALFLTLSLLGWKFTVGRLIFGVSSGILVGFLTEKIVKRALPEPEPVRIDVPSNVPEEEKNYAERLKDMFLYSWEFVKMVLPLILLGVALAGMVKAFLPASFITKYLGNGRLSIMLSSAMGVIMYTPSLVEAPLMRGLLESGMGTGAAMAFLLTGPALSLPSILGVCRVVSPRVPAVYAFLMWICGTLSGLAFWYFVPGVNF